jgi:hypothetical protein
MNLKNLGYAALLTFATAGLVLGTAGSSEAAKKKAAAAPPPPPPVFCFVPDKQVCAVKGGMKFTYSNACVAAKDGAKVVSDKACPVKAAAKDGKKKGGKKAAKKPTKKK